MPTLSRILIPVFGLIAIVGGVLASGRLGDSGVFLAFGITLLVIGCVGVLNVIMFTRLKANIDRAAEQQRAELSQKHEDDD